MAIEAAEAWRHAALDARRALEGAFVDDEAPALRWVAPPLMHVTLSFLGDVEQSRLGPLQAALDSVAPAAPLALHTGPPATFGRPDRTRVVWLALEGDTAALTGLAARVDGAARTAVALAPPRDAPNGVPVPHLTLARVRDRARRETRVAIARAVQAAAPHVTPSTTVAVHRIALVRSHLGAGGPRYEVLSEHGGSTDDRDAGREVDAPMRGG